MRERHRQTATKPTYYIRGIEITAISGLGRFGAGVASPATSSTIIMSSTWASVVPDGTVPKDYPRHFGGLSARPRASVSRRSPRRRAHRGPSELVDQGQHIEVRAERAGREQLRGSSPPFPHGRVHSRTLAMATGRPKIYIYIQTDRDKTHILYKRD